MDFLKRNAKRVGIDAAGYLLVVAAILTGWLPGPGGIPLALAGLGLLSINNPWAERLRKLLLKHSGRLVKVMFPNNRFVQWIYDGLVFLLLGFVVLLEFQHDAIWQISLGIALFFIAVFVALLNRDRLHSLQKKK